MQYLHFIAGPAIGALIGYCTNYIAVKMLFRPLKPMKIGNYTLPFTPGIIPKRKPALAKTIGKAIGTALLTKDDMKNALLSDKMLKTITDMFLKQINKLLKSEHTIKETALLAISEGNYMQMSGKLQEMAIDKIMENIEQMGIGELLVEEAKKVIKEKFSNPLMAMFLNDELIDSIAKPIGESIENYVKENGRTYIEEAVEREILNLEQTQICEITEELHINYDKVAEQIKEVYTTFIETGADKVLNQFKVAEIVEEKINDMDVLEVEELVLSVMKHELNMIVNLGALIGLILGFANLFLI